MEITFTGRKIEVTPALKNYVSEKLNRLNKFNLIRVQIIFSLEKITHSIEAIAHLKGLEVNAKASAADMYEAIDQLMDKLQTQIKKHKDKITDHRE